MLKFVIPLNSVIIMSELQCQPQIKFHLYFEYEHFMIMHMRIKLMNLHKSTFILYTLNVTYGIFALLTDS